MRSVMRSVQWGMGLAALLAVPAVAAAQQVNGDSVLDRAQLPDRHGDDADYDRLKVGSRLQPRHHRPERLEEAPCLGKLTRPSEAKRGVGASHQPGR